MKKALLTLATFGLIIGGANAAALVNKTFTHADGNLVGNTPTTGGAWASHRGAGNIPIQVTSGQAVVTHGSGSREDASAFSFRQSTSSESETIRVDNPIVDTTFAAAVPEPSSLVLVSLIGFLGMFRRRRRG